VSKLRDNLGTTLAYLVLIAYALLSLYPFLWMVSSALKSNQEVLGSQSLIPKEIHLDVIVNTWNQLDFFRYFINSVIVALLAVAGIVVVYSMAGFGFAKTKFVGRNVLFIAFLALLFVPGVTVLVPLVQLLKALALIGRDATQVATYTGLIMPTINGAGPLSIFLFRNYFASLPDELFDAARVDGASLWRIYLGIFLPLATPVIATVGILNFIGIWSA
jgi:multiple sugar transport system permease protein